jgi:PAS domain S-box-containing protein
MTTDLKQAETLLVVQRDLGIALGGAADLTEALDAVLEAATRIEGIDSGGAYLVDEASGDVRIAASRGLSEEFVAATACYAADTPNARIVMAGTPRYVAYREMVEKEIGRPFDDVRRRERLKTFAGVPIVHHGEVVGCINAASHEVIDIPETSRQALESIASRVGSTIARIRAEERLRDSEARYRAIFDHAMDGILLAHVGTRRFLSGNRRICDMLGYAPEEIRGLSVEDIHPRDTLLAVFEHFEEQAKGGGHLAADLPVLRKDGSMFHVDISSGVITLGGERYLIGIFRDVTDRRKAEAESHRAQRLESLGLLAGGIAHDFNNILTAVVGGISLARLRSRNGAPIGDLLDEAEKAAYRARDLTQQLLTFARGGTPVRRVCAVGGLVTDAATFALHGSTARAHVEAAVDLWPADVDAGQIGQVLHNLVLNAAQAMPGGGVVSVAAENFTASGREAAALSPGRYVRISVVDRGCGIPEENLAHIFDPYFTTKDSGSGLGLAVAHSIVRKHGGRIDVESTVGAGSTFRVYLPAASGVPEESGGEACERRRLEGRILVMDDDRAVREVARGMLEALGCEAAVACDGREAIGAWTEARDAGRPFDAVILDLTVQGGMGGVDCLAALARLDPSVKALVSSGYSTDPVLADSRRFGFSGVICKPYRIELLHEALEKVLEGG